MYKYISNVSYIDAKVAHDTLLFFFLSFLLLIIYYYYTLSTFYYYLAPPPPPPPPSPHTITYSTDQIHKCTRNLKAKMI